MTPEELFFRRVVVSASGLLYWGGVLIQARRVRKQIGRSPNLKPRGSREKALWIGWFIVILTWIGQPFLINSNTSSPALHVFDSLPHLVGLILGLSLVAMGYVGTLWCYMAMGDTWRIGINAKEKTTLVSNGPYLWVRHPIYLFQIVMLAGAALLLPTAASFGILAIHYFCVQIKAADEEKYLETVHGEAYRNYQSRTGGLFPKFLRG